MKDRRTKIRNAAMIVDPGNFVGLKHGPERAGVLLKGRKDAAGTRMAEVLLAGGQGPS